MSLYGMMRTGVSGMNAQANRLSTVADNIANAGTTGYKRSSTEFASLIIPNATGNYTSGGVTTSVRYATSQQGDLKYTSSHDRSRHQRRRLLRRPGSERNTVPDARRLVRAGRRRTAGQCRRLLPDGLQCGQWLAQRRHQRLRRPRARAGVADRADRGAVGERHLHRQPAGRRSHRAAGKPAFGQTATAQYSAKSSLVVYDNLGSEVLLDIYFTKTGGEHLGSGGLRPGRTRQRRRPSPTVHRVHRSWRHRR